MNEADVRGKVFKTLRLLGYWPITQTDATICPRCRTKVKPPIGRPDILVLHPTAKDLVVEVKALRPADTAFPFDRISPEQRKWLDRWEEVGGRGYIGLGAIRKHQSRDHLEYLWLVDWTDWKEIEGLVSPIQSSIPFAAGKGMRRAIQEHDYCLPAMLKPWALARQNGAWEIPDAHSAWPQEVGR